MSAWKQCTIQEMTRDDAERWLAEAEADVATAAVLLTSGRYNPCAFYSQQAAEKALKALIYLIDADPWGHSVLALVDDLERRGWTVDPELRAAARRLDHHYIAARYPDAFPAGTPTDFYDEDLATTAHTDARAVVAYARRQIKEASSAP